MTSIDKDTMISEQKSSPLPGLLSLAVSDIGEYLRVKMPKFDDYPGWRQVRKFRSDRFDIMGYGEKPRLEVLKIWKQIDDDFIEFSSRCIQAVKTHVDTLKLQDHDKTPLGCIIAIKDAISSESLKISNVMFGETAVSRVLLNYPDIDSYYLTPSVTMSEYEIIETEIVP